MEVARRRGRRRKKLLDDLKDRRGYSHLKEEALDRTMWRNRFGGGFGPVVRQNTEWMNETIYHNARLKNRNAIGFFEISENWWTRRHNTDDFCPQPSASQTGFCSMKSERLRIVLWQGKCALSRGPGVITPRLLYRKYRHEANWRPCTFEGVTFQHKLVMKVTTRIWKLWGSRDGDCSVSHFWNMTPWGLVADRGVVPSHLLLYLNMLSFQNFSLLHRIWRQ